MTSQQRGQHWTETRGSLRRMKGQTITESCGPLPEWKQNRHQTNITSNWVRTNLDVKFDASTSTVETPLLTTSRFSSEPSHMNATCTYLIPVAVCSPALTGVCGVCDFTSCPHSFITHHIVGPSLISCRCTSPGLVFYWLCVSMSADTHLFR